MSALAPFEPRTYWPQGPTTLLLKTAFHHDETVARAAFETWERDIEFDDLIWTDLRLMPFVDERLKALGIKPVNGPRIAGIRRRLWAHSTMVLKGAQPALEALGDFGIPLLIFKGAERILSRQGGGANRYIADVDVLVPQNRIAETIDWLESNGWRNDRDTDPSTIKELMQSSRHSIGFRGPGGAEIDLHGHALLLNLCPDHDDGLWERAQPIVDAPAGAVGPSPADRLIIACGHGLINDPHGSLDWVADAAGTVMGDPVDWKVFERAARHRMLPVHALVLTTYLIEELGLPLPPDLPARLEENVTEDLQEEFRAHTRHWEATSGPDRRTRAAGLLARARQWNARCAHRPEDQAPPHFDGPWQLAEKTGKSGIRTVPVPDECRRPGPAIQLEVWLRSRDVMVDKDLSVALVCFEPHRVELRRYRFNWHQRLFLAVKPVVVTFDIEPAFIAAYGLESMDIEILLGEGLGRSRIMLKPVYFRWSAADVN